MIYKAYNEILQYITTFLAKYLGLTQMQAEELSPIILIFLAVLLTYLTSHMFTAFRKYVSAVIVLFAVVILVAVVMK
ncbi:hypothetical protein [Saccharolobus sp. E5-1-F]|uniref:hypothetical protein n=1 Tax=Saccharolobus sp. E5-1-F TaxID=2663019 RepID=UPI001EE97960|nr:hypothetical protein [Sulfolobus sp. E5-1-F]